MGFYVGTFVGFQSTPPVKAATFEAASRVTVEVISIHAAREGGDVPADSTKHIRRKFQSTPPVKAATKLLAPYTAFESISIHAAREGGDAGIHVGI